MTKSQIIAQSGGDYDDNISEIARETALAADLGVTLDRDIIPATPKQGDLFAGSPDTASGDVSPGPVSP